MREILRVLRNPTLLIVFGMGFTSGLPFLLVKSTLKAWLTADGLSLTAIGLFTAVSQPYLWKVVWSPLMDRYNPLGIGRRKSWLAVTQAGITVGLFALSRLHPAEAVRWVAVIAFMIAFFSSSQDIVIDAYRREVLPDEELGLGVSLYVLGYRIALLLTGGGAFYLAARMPWSQVYFVMSVIMGACFAITLFAPEPKINTPRPRTLQEAVVLPLKEFFTRDKALWFLLFVVLYKMGESMASDMYNTFFIKRGFTYDDIAYVAKVLGFWASISGGLIGGILMVRLKTFRALWYFGILQSVCLLLFVGVAIVPHKYLLAAAVTTENFTSGMAATAAVALMASLCSKQFTATQYALLSSLTQLPGSLIGMSSGYLAEQLGWQNYYIFCTVITFPGLFVLYSLRPTIDAMSAKLSQTSA